MSCISVDIDATAVQSRDDHQSCYRSNAFTTETGSGHGSSNAYNEQGKVTEVVKMCFE
ncbi:MAG: hypothetical protein K6G27_02210 [Lachnospiraceae bacterium]|nr:hypothetical protein [Lachnospiraceae bacterium]